MVHGDQTCNYVDQVPELPCNRWASQNKQITDGRNIFRVDWKDRRQTIKTKTIFIFTFYQPEDWRDKQMKIVSLAVEECHNNEITTVSLSCWTQVESWDLEVRRSRYLPISILIDQSWICTVFHPNWVICVYILYRPANTIIFSNIWLILVTKISI